MDDVLTTIQIECMSKTAREHLALRDRMITARSSALKATNSLLRSSAANRKWRSVLVVIGIAMTQRKELHRLRKGRTRYIWNYTE